ncbi:Fumarate hydratase class I OS=Streptomyces fumanus OX=67302 GN=GCM10018772_41270 PE=3 SV=1 [Streptomyces fumanus]
MPEFAYTDLLPMGEDTTPYRLVTSEVLPPSRPTGGPSSRWSREALRKLAEEAIHDIEHYLRPAHLAQLRRIVDDPRRRPTTSSSPWTC